MLTALACGRPDAPPLAAPSADLLVSARSGSLQAPDTLAAGWRTFRVEEDGKGHIVVLFRLPDSAGADLAPVIAALDTSPATPPPLVALGGPEMGDTGQVTLRVQPGKYLVACLSRGGDGHRHAAAGEAHLLTVKSSGNEGIAPVATEEIGLTDFAFLGSDQWKPGAQRLRVENRGAQDHQLRLVRLDSGTTIQQWLTSEGETATDVAGVARIGPGREAFLDLQLSPGTYVGYCLVTDPASRRQHVEMGMYRSFQVN